MSYYLRQRMEEREEFCVKINVWGENGFMEEKRGGGFLQLNHFNGWGRNVNEEVSLHQWLTRNM